MGIYIPGMKMPKDCRECPFFGYTAEDDFMCLIQDGEDTCRLEELPPHGRLIDADALRAEHGLGEICENCPVDKRYCQYEMIYTKMEVCGWLDDATTVIPAEEGGASDD